MRKLFPPALIAAVAMTGCVRYRAHSLDPAQSEQEYHARSVNDAGLREFLGRPDWPPARLGLNDLLAVALYFNRDLDVARAQLRTARAAVLTAKGKPNPSISTGGGWESSPESPLVFHFDPALTLVTAGKRGLRILESEKLAEAARVQLEDSAWRVRSRVRAAWVDHLLALRSLDAWRGETQARREVAAILEARLKAGEASRPEADVTRVALISAEVEAKAAETSVGETAAVLAAATGLPALPAIDTEALPALPAAPPVADVQQSGLQRRADVRRSLLEYAAAEADLRLEIARQYPDIDLSPGYGFDEGHHKITFGPSFQIPLFNRNRGPIAEADARRSEAEARFNALQAQAIGDLEIALARYKGALAELSDAELRLVGIQQRREADMQRAVQAGEEDRLALASVRVEGALAARARLDALRRSETALGALEDSVQRSFDPGAAGLPSPEKKP